MNLTHNERSIIAQLRLGVLPLEIELGRFCNARSVEERICKLCNEAVEDEIHFTCECPFYTIERHNFYENVNVDSSQDKVYILKYLFEEKSRQLAKYLLSIMHIRNGNRN